MSKFNKIATEYLLKWGIEEIKEELLYGIIGIILLILGKFIIWPKLVEIWNKINRT